VRGTLQQNADSMKCGQRRQVKCILTLAREIDIHLVKNTVAQIGLLIQRALDGIALAPWEERE
jgi:hypothetical protein